MTPQAIRRRADAAPACWRGPDGRPEHVVEPNPRGWFDVTSSRSGKVYRVHLDGSCECDGYRRSLRCSHVAAVLAFAAAVLERRR